MQSPTSAILMRQIRLLQIAVGLLSILALASLGLLLADRTTETAAGGTSTNEIVVTDEHGEVRARLAGTTRGAVLALYDANGRVALHLSTEADEPNITLFDEAGRRRLSLYVSAMGGALAVLGDSSPRIFLGETANGGAITLHDAAGIPRAALGLIEYENPSRLGEPQGMLRLYDQSGRLFYVIEDPAAP